MTLFLNHFWAHISLYYNKITLNFHRKNMLMNRHLAILKDQNQLFSYFLINQSIYSQVSNLYKLFCCDANEIRQDIFVKNTILPKFLIKTLFILSV